MSVWCKCRETECELTYLYNQPSCNFHFLRDHHYNVRHLLHKLNHCICESSTSIRGHMSLNTGSTLPKVARIRQQLVEKTASQMHVAPRIVVFCWSCPRHAPDDVIIHCGYQKLPLDGAVIGTFEYCSISYWPRPPHFFGEKFQKNLSFFLIKSPLFLAKLCQ